MKKIYILLLFMLMFIPNMVSGKEEVNTCEYNYEYGITPVTKRKTYIQVKVTVYDDDTAKVEYPIKKDGKTDWGTSGAIVILQKKDDEYWEYETKSVNVFNQTFMPSYKEGKKCPYLVQQIGLDGKLQLLFSNDSKTCSIGGNTCIKPIKDNSFETNKKIANYKFYLKEDEFSTLPEVEISLNVYEDETKELCLREHGEEIAFCDTLKKGETYSASDIVLKVKTKDVPSENIIIYGSQVDKIFNLKDDKFSFEKLFLVRELQVSPANFELTTTDESAIHDRIYYDIINKKVLEGDSYKEPEKPEDPQDPSDPQEFTCSGLKTIEWLQKLFDLIKIIGPILVVLFSAYDYLKSIFSLNDDALTKTNQRFIKRVIAAVLIFLLPALLSIILNFVGDRFGADICGIK